MAGQNHAYSPGNFDSAHVYVQWGGKLPGAEDWSCGLRLRKKSGSAVIADGVSLLPNVAAAVSAFHTRDKTNLGTGAKLSFVKVNTIAVTGHYADSGGTNQAIFATCPALARARRPSRTRSPSPSR